MRSSRGGDKKTPELMDPTRERDRGRILALFKPYRVRLTVVLVMIVIAAGVSMLSPFLLRQALDVGLFQHNDAVLTATVLGMIGVAVFTNATAVWQTYLSNVVGQRVMHDLRAAVYRHLQRMSLAFFTRTRTGEVQSRIANDIGGLDSVVTTTATTIASNATTVIASLVAMCILNWRLALLSLIFVPPSVWGTRRVGKIRRRITTEQQKRLADMSALVAESLSVSGIMLGKTMGRGQDLAERFTGESKGIADLEVRSRMTGRWMMATIQFIFAVQPAVVYWLAGQTFVGGAISIGTVVAFTTLQTRLLFPINSLLGTQADLESSMALFDRIFEYLDLPIDIVEASDPVTLRPDEVLGEVRFEDVSFRYDVPGTDSEEWTLRHIDLVVPAGTRTAIVGETGAGKTTLGYLAARLYEPQEGRVTVDGVDIRDVSLASLAAHGGRRLPGDVPVPRQRPREPALRAARRHRRGDRGRRPHRAHPRPGRVAARRVRHDRGRARLPLLGRREAADGHRPHRAAQPAGARARRGHELPGHAHRVRRAGRARAAGRGAHHDHHRPSSLDGARRRPDRGPRRRQHRRARHP